MSRGDALVRLRGVSVSYSTRLGMFRWGRHPVLRNLDLDLHRGESVGVIGRNGSGKSTLLRIIAGLIEPDSGRIESTGVRISLLALGVGFMPHLTGRENVMLSGMLMGLRRREIAARMGAVLDFAGVGDYIDQPLHAYSTGMRARLGFSTAIQSDPDVLLIDEVLGVGDEEFRAKSSAEIRRIIRSDRTVVLVSHAMASIRSLTETALWIEGPDVVSSGQSAAVVDAYLAAQRQSASVPGRPG